MSTSLLLFFYYATYLGVKNQNVVLIAKYLINLLKSNPGIFSVHEGQFSLAL